MCIRDRGMPANMVPPGRSPNASRTFSRWQDSMPRPDRFSRRVIWAATRVRRRLCRLLDALATPGPIRLTSSQADDIHTDEEGASTLASSGHESSPMDPGAHGVRSNASALGALLNCHEVLQVRACDSPESVRQGRSEAPVCLLYTSDAADD